MTNLRQALGAFHADVYKYLFAMGIVGFSYFGFVSVLLNLYLLRSATGPISSAWSTAALRSPSRRPRCRPGHLAPAWGCAVRRRSAWPC